MVSSWWWPELLIIPGLLLLCLYTKRLNCGCASLFPVGRYVTCSLRVSLREADGGTVQALEAASKEAEGLREEVETLRQKLQVCHRRALFWDRSFCQCTAWKDPCLAVSEVDIRAICYREESLPAARITCTKPAARLTRAKG